MGAHSPFIVTSLLVVPVKWHHGMHVLFNDALTRGSMVLTAELWLNALTLRWRWRWHATLTGALGVDHLRGGRVCGESVSY
jgi:hypothetical protein